MGEDLFPSLETAVFLLLCPHMWRVLTGRGKPAGFLEEHESHRGVPTLMISSKPSTSRRPHLQIPSCWGLGLPHRNLRGAQFSPQHHPSSRVRLFGNGAPRWPVTPVALSIFTSVGWCPGVDCWVPGWKLFLIHQGLPDCFSERPITLLSAHSHQRFLETFCHSDGFWSGASTMWFFSDHW